MVLNINKPGLLKLMDSLKKLVVDYCREMQTFTGLKNLEVYNKFNHGSFNIGNVKIKNPIISAPLAGISDNTFRIFASAFGTALNFTEMISSFGVHYNNRATEKLSYITEYERPCAVQIFGCDPEIILEAAQKLEERADIIDINMGCPVPKVLKTKSGGFLLNDKKNVEKIIFKVAGKIKKPLTIKIRLGWDANNINAPDIVKIAENNGAAAVTIHGRTVKQGFNGKADYEIIKTIKENSKIPVIVSGDINSPRKAKQVLDYTGCEAAMIGRSARGKPWIFFNMISCLNNFSIKRNTTEKNDRNRLLPDSNIILDLFNFEPSNEFKKKFSLLYLKFLIEFEGEESAVRQFRKYLVWIFKGVSNISRIKKEFFTIKNCNDLAELLNPI